MESFTFDKIEYTIFVGKNRTNNWELIDNAKDSDIWFHIANSSSCHVVLQTDIPINKIPRQVIKRCACLCKSNSNSKSEKNCEIIYTSINNVTKTKNVGEVTVTNTKKILI
jgi:hypothetical protein